MLIKRKLRPHSDIVVTVLWGFEMSGAEEKRKSVRKRTLKKGTIVFNNRYCSASCTVRNESETGVLLEIDNNHLIPSHVELNIIPGTIYRPIQVMWRTEEAIGVKYVDMDKSEAPAVPDDIDAADVVEEPKPAPPRPIETLSGDYLDRRNSGVKDRRKAEK